MKKLINRFRHWLVKKLDAIELEAHDREVKALLDRISKMYIRARRRECAYSAAVQEICRRSGRTYYDWCCDHCARTCAERDGWCELFDPCRE